MQRFDARYGTVYEINLCGMSGIGSSKIVLSSCVCKLDGTIVEGDLFAGRESLSKRELSLINGEFSANKSIQKLEYVTVDNQPRTLVFIFSIWYNEFQYAKSKQDQTRHRREEPT